LTTRVCRAPAPSKSGADKFDLVFSDVMMPGQSGIDFAHDISVVYPI
jgi:CheY-like chemotaxis protein